MTNLATGQRAEAVAAGYLVERGYKILQQNWRTRYCEIDIVASRAGTVHFVEVKYRSTDQQGSGLDYITAQKLRQMNFAAQLWMQNHQWQGGVVLSALAVSGPNFTVTEFIEALV